MAVVESTPKRLVLQSGWALNKLTLTFDKDERRARLQRTVAMWGLKPTEVDFADIADVAVATMKDPLSGGELHSALMRLNSGIAVEVPASEREVTETVARVRDFLGLDATAG
jgi:hydrogenase maturation factor